MATQYCTGDDGLVVEKVGHWAKQKHKISHRLCICGRRREDAIP